MRIICYGRCLHVVHTSINTLTRIQVLHQRTLLPKEVHQQSKFRFRAQGLGFGNGVFHGVHSHLEFFVRSCNKLLPTMSLLRHHNKFFINIQIESTHNRNSQRALQRNSIHFGTGYFYKKKMNWRQNFNFSQWFSYSKILISIFRRFMKCKKKPKN